MSLLDRFRRRPPWKFPRWIARPLGAYFRWILPVARSNVRYEIAGVSAEWLYKRGVLP